MATKKKQPVSFWNFRVGTYIEKLHPEIAKLRKPERLYMIIECHYKSNKPTGYGEKDLLIHMGSVKDLIWSHKKIAEAFNKPILDLDNWPNEYTGKAK